MEQPRRKAMQSVDVKAGDEGRVEAVFATLDVIDHDGDVLRKSAFTEGAPVVISAYGHRSHHGELPIGKGRIVLTDTEAKMVGQFFLDTTHGRDAFNTIKGLSEDDSLQEWSFSLRDIESHTEKVAGRDANVITAVTVKEVSPVLEGAGIDTRTLVAKTAKTAVAVHHTGTDTDGAWDGAAAEAALDSPMPVATARAMYAWLDAGEVDAGEIVKSYCKMPHHDVSGGRPGAANMRACAAIVAALNGGRGGGVDIPADERQGVYNHVAAHYRDADMDPPELRALEPADTKRSARQREAELLEAGRARWADEHEVSVADWDTHRATATYALTSPTGAQRLVQVAYAADGHAVTLDDDETDVDLVTHYVPKGARFVEQAEAVAADLAALTDRAAEIVAMRAAIGKTLSPATAAVLGHVAAEAERLKTLVVPPTFAEKWSPLVALLELAELEAAG